MNSNRFSNEVLSMLRSSGWYEGRQVDITNIVDFLRTNGIEPNSMALEFLKEFHRLYVAPSGRYGVSFVRFDAHEVMGFIDSDELSLLESLLNQRLCPVGAGGRWLLFMTSAGEIVFLHDEWLMYVRAKDVPDAFESICHLKVPGVEEVMLTDDQKPAAYREPP